MPRVLITAEAVQGLPGPHVDLLRAAGYEVAYPSKIPLLTEADTLGELRGFVGVVAGTEPYTECVLAELPELRVIARNGVGFDCIDVAAAARRGIAVTITPDANHQAVAEHTLALMLAIARRVVTGVIDTRAGRWQRRTVFVPLRDATLGIVGLGRIGRSVAVLARAFGMRLIAFDLVPNAEVARQHAVELVDLDTLLAQSDFVTLHAPLTAETRELINARTLERMKPGSILINAARGGLVDEGDLLGALQSGHLAGAALDVLACEPPPADHPLLALENVIVTPHVASFDTKAREDMAVAAAQNIVDLLGGRWPAGSIVNPQVQASWPRRA